MILELKIISATSRLKHEQLTEDNLALILR